MSFGHTFYGSSHPGHKSYSSDISSDPDNWGNSIRNSVCSCPACSEKRLEMKHNLERNMKMFDSMGSRGEDRSK